MPDEKTACISDDGANVGLFRSVADTAGDLSAAQLYAAKWNQTRDFCAGTADNSWVDLGHAGDATIRTAIADMVGFMNIFNVGEMAEGGTCAEGFLAFATEGWVECLQVKDGMEAVASRLETRRYAAMLSATVAFRKMEGNVYNPDNNSLYLAMSEVAKGVTDGDDPGLGSSNDVRVAKNPCSAVYELSLDDNFVATNMKAVIEGKPTTYAEGSDYAGNACDVDGIANPNNVTCIPT